MLLGILPQWCRTYQNLKVHGHSAYLVLSTASWWRYQYPRLVRPHYMPTSCGLSDHATFSPQFTPPWRETPSWFPQHTKPTPHLRAIAPLAPSPGKGSFPDENTTHSLTFFHSLLRYHLIQEAFQDHVPKVPPDHCIPHLPALFVFIIL